jgi:release factor glutamine methyltransferase
MKDLIIKHGSGSLLYDRIRENLVFGHSVYSSRQDSRMLASAVERYAFGRMLDMGAGTGVQGIVAAKKGCAVTFADKNPEAITCSRLNAKRNGVHGVFVVSDLFSNIKGRFNTVAFDPPYLRSFLVPRRMQNCALHGGGMRGRGTMDRFLADYAEHVLRDHLVLMVEPPWAGWKKDAQVLDAKVVEKKRYPLLGTFVVLMFE